MMVLQMRLVRVIFKALLSEIKFARQSGQNMILKTFSRLSGI